MAEAQEDAQRTAIVSSFFYFLGDVLKGADGTGAPDRGWMRNDQLMGPNSQGAGLYLGADGRYHTRGSSTVPPASQAQTAAAAFTVTPGMLLLAGLAFLILRK